MVEGNAVRQPGDGKSLLPPSVLMSSEYRHLEALAFCISVDVIRKAKGKPNPKDLEPGSMERMLA
ncbi:hypothetical protein [Paraburkholderia hospita]|uniref:hypothetical protein n=1 Tax=Paraburkholderia hospita TaxID=169430 RepID=UPI000B3463E7|nr:hypothetical protein [Paraburkholderia hospita]